MSCQGCVESVKRILSRIPGITVHSVQIGNASVSVHDAQADVPRIIAGLGKAGYPAEVSQGQGA